MTGPEILYALSYPVAVLALGLVVTLIAVRNP